MNSDQVQYPFLYLEQNHYSSLSLYVEATGESLIRRTNENNHLCIETRYNIRLWVCVLQLNVNHGMKRLKFYLFSFTQYFKRDTQ